MEQSLAIAEAGIKSKEFGLIILDSIGSLAPKKVKEDELTDANVALIASRLTVFVQRNGYAIQSSNVSFIGINQVRDKIGSYFNEMHTPGGHAWKHILSLRIQLARASDIEQDGEKIGIMTRFVIKKNKLARPFRTYMIPIMFGKGIDSTRDLIEFATMLGVLDKSGPYVKYNGNTIGLGIAKTADAFISNPELMQEIISKCYESVK
jgi:recombination protein RecA